VIDADAVDWGQLSERGRWTVCYVGIPLACGLTTREIAKQVGQRPKWVSERLAELRTELMRIAVSP
jgi:ACR3 family arsenite efflux pump ArsB